MYPECVVKGDNTEIVNVEVQQEIEDTGFFYIEAEVLNSLAWELNGFSKKRQNP